MRNGRRVGVVEVKFEKADSALVVLMIGDSTVRRQWFEDSTRARNNRLLAVRHFDKDLNMIRKAVLESADSKIFEQGVAALLFLLGFAPSVQLETDAPDLIVTTPGGKLALIECTIRIADFSTKLGKLVDRRGALAKTMQASGHPARIYSVLVSRAPRDQIAAKSQELEGHQVVLITHEDLVGVFERVRFSNDPDEMLETATNALEVAQRILGG